MAIAYDNVLIRAENTGVTSVTRAFTITGSNTAIVAGVIHTTASNITSVTYAGVNLTQIHSNIVGEGSLRVDLWLLIGTATGSNNLVINNSASDTINSFATSYTGVTTGGDTGGSDSKASNSFSSSSGNHSLNYTTVADNTWAVIVGRTQEVHTASTNVTFRNSISGVIFIGDNNGSGFGTAGAHTQTVNSVAASVGALAGVALKPLVAVPGTNKLPLLGVG